MLIECNAAIFRQTPAYVQRSYLLVSQPNPQPRQGQLHPKRSAICEHQRERELSVRFNFPHDEFTPHQNTPTLQILQKKGTRETKCEAGRGWGRDYRRIRLTGNMLMPTIKKKKDIETRATSSEMYMKTTSRRCWREQTGKGKNMGNEYMYMQPSL